MDPHAKVSAILHSNMRKTVWLKKNILATPSCTALIFFQTSKNQIILSQQQKDKPSY